MNAPVTPNQKQPSASETLEQTRHNYSVQARMEESDDNTRAGVMIKSNQQAKFKGADQKKGKTSLNDILMMQDATNSLANFELMMAKKYGEDFDLHLAAEFLDEETYQKLASIQDKEQRREAISNAIQEGIKSGSINRDAVGDFNTELLDWVDKRADEREIELTNSMQYQQQADIQSQQENAFSTNHDNQLEKGLDNLFSMNGP